MLAPASLLSVLPCGCEDSEHQQALRLIGLQQKHAFCTGKHSHDTSWSRANGRRLWRKLRDIWNQDGGGKQFFSLTEFIKVCFSSVLLHDWTHHPGFEEGGPFVHQAPLSSNVILEKKHTTAWTTKHEQWFITKDKRRDLLDTLWPPWCGCF